MKTLASIFLFLQMQTLLALGNYQPGDTLYVWALSGLTLRDGPSLKAPKLGNVPYGTMLIASNYNSDHRTSVVAVPGFKTGDVSSPALALGGDFAEVTFQGVKGYVFDGYLSTLPAFKYFSKDDAGRPNFEPYLDWATRNFGLLKKTQTGTFEFAKPSTAEWIFGNGILLSKRAEKDAQDRLVLPNISMEEAYLVFNLMNNYEWHISMHDPSDPEGYRFEIKSQDVWVFYTGTCENIIRYLPYEHIAIISGACSC